MAKRPINPRLTPVRALTDRILIVYSAAGTDQADLDQATRAVEAFNGADDFRVKVEAQLFGIPNRSRPGFSLGTELTGALDSCVGGIAFVDHLRPNVAYELGYLHGRGRPILLVTRGKVARTWTVISDLAGAPLADLRRTTLPAAIHAYIDRLYREDLRLVERVPGFPLPSAESNLLGDVNELSLRSESGPYGALLTLDRYEPPIVVPVRRNISVDARVQLILRAPGGTEHFSVYFLVWYSNQRRDPACINLGITSHRRDAWITRDERQLPGPTLTASWTCLALQFADLFRRGSVLGTSSPDFLEHVSFRIGHRIQDMPELKKVEVAYLGVTGFND